MKYLNSFIALLLVVLITSCGTTNRVPITGRKQSLLVSEQQILSLSNQQYKEYMSSAKRSTNVTNTEMVKKVGRRLADAVTSYLNANGMGSEVKNYIWEFSAREKC